MASRGHYFGLVLFLLGLPFIHAEREPHEGDVCNVYRQDYGAPIPSYTVSRTCGENGPLVLEDITYIKLIAGYTREKTPERTVAAKAAGAFGYFELTHDLSEYTKSAMFSHVGRKTPMVCRFSISVGRSGVPDTTRSHNGFACKFYTTEGNWDLVATHVPVFFIRDPILYPAFVHAQEGRDPVTGRINPNIKWDFFTKRQECLSALVYFFSDSGTTYGYRYMHGFSVNAFKFVNKHNKAIYVKFTWKSDQGIKNFTIEEAKRMKGEDPDFFTKDLYDSIQEGNYPYWTMCIQWMTLEQAARAKFNPFDATLLWPEHEYPCKPVGRMVLNKNPENFFSEVDQAGYSPSALTSGIELSPDRLLQGRVFAYDDAQRYRLGINSKQLPVNRPKGVPCKRHSLNRDGLMSFDNQFGQANYYPNSFAPYHPDPTMEFAHYRVNGTVGRHDLGDKPNWEQARTIYGEFSKRDKEHLAKNIGIDIQGVIPQIQCKVLKMFRGVSEHLFNRIQFYGDLSYQDLKC